MRPRYLVLKPLPLLALLLLAGCALPVVSELHAPPLTPWSTIYGTARDERSVAEILYDKAISTAIKAELIDKNGGLGLDVKVYCFLRRVTLLGQLDDHDFKAFAVATAWKAEGVRSVSTAWAAPATKEGHLKDLEVAARLCAALVGDKDLSATQIEAEVFNGHVFLLGMVRSQGDASRAMAHARGLKGVAGATSFLIPTEQDMAGHHLHGRRVDRQAGH